MMPVGPRSAIEAASETDLAAAAGKAVAARVRAYLETKKGSFEGGYDAGAGSGES